MRRIRGLGAGVLVIILITQAGAHRASGQTAPGSDEAKRFIGTWRLVSDVSTGLMYYDSLGNMAAQVMPNRARPRYAGAQPTPEEAKDALTGYLAYFGTYSVDERAHTITHHRKANINPGQINDDAVRRYEFVSGDRVILRPVDSGNPIVWERAR
jgi:Lipocalin-like domain